MKGRPHQVPPLDRALAISAYRDHMPVPDIAKALLRNEAVIYRILNQAGYGRNKSWNKPRPYAVRSKKSSTKLIEASKPKGKRGRKQWKRQLLPRHHDPLLTSLQNAARPTVTIQTTRR